MKKKLLSLLSLACAITVGLTATACGGGGEATAEAFVTIDINPSIELTLDKNNVVLSAYGGNEDGQILLYNETGIVGANVENAVGKITDLAQEYGYLSEANTVINTSVVAKNPDAEKNILNKVNAKINATASDFNFTVTTTSDKAYSIVRKYQEFLAAHPNADVDLDDFHLALCASETGEVTLEVAVTLDDDDLIRIINKAHKAGKEFMTNAYAQAKATAEKAFSLAEKTALDSIYMTHYMANYLNHKNTFYYGAEYFAYKTTARTLEIVADGMSAVESAFKKNLDQNQISAIMTALNITDQTLIQDGNGNVTIESIEAYADRLFKNSELNAELELVKQNLTIALNNAQTAIQAQLNVVLDEYQDEIEDIVEDIAEEIPEYVLERLGEFNTMAKQLERLLDHGRVSAYEVREVAKTFEDKAQEVLAKIEKDLSASEKKAIETVKNEVVKTLETARAQMQNQIDDAEDLAEDYFDRLKAEIRQQTAGQVA